MAPSSSHHQKKSHRPKKPHNPPTRTHTHTQPSPEPAANTNVNVAVAENGKPQPPYSPSSSSPFNGHPKPKGNTLRDISVDGSDYTHDHPHDCNCEQTQYPNSNPSPSPRLGRNKNSVNGVVSEKKFVAAAAAPGAAADSSVGEEVEKRKKQLTNLARLHEALLKESAFLRSCESKAGERIAALEREAVQKEAETGALTAEKASLEAEVSELAAEIPLLSLRAAEMAEEVNKAGKGKEVLEREVALLESALVESRAEAEEVSRKLWEAESAAASAQDSVGALESAVEALKEEASALEKERDFSCTENARMGSECSLLKERLGRLKEELSVAEKARESAEALLHNAVSEVERLQLASESLKRENNQFRIDLAESLQKLSSLETQQGLLESKRDQLKSLATTLKEEISAADFRLQESRKVLNDEKETRCALQTRLENAELKKRGFEEALESLRLSVIQAQESSEQSRARVAELSQQASRLEDENRKLKEGPIQTLREDILEASRVEKEKITHLSDEVVRLEFELSQVAEVRRSHDEKSNRISNDLRALTIESENKSKLVRFSVASLGLLSTSSIIALAFAYKLG